MKRRNLKIAQIAPLWFPIPPKKYGGTERIISYLTEELTKRGHRVTLFASADSKTKAKLASVSKKGLVSRKIPWDDWCWNNFNYSLVFKEAKKFDIIHSHWTPLGIFFEQFVKTPVLHTFHNTPIKTDHRWQILKYYKKDSNVVFVSRKQKRNAPFSFKNQWVVYNGVDFSQFKFKKEPKDHLVWIGRISKKKGIENAILAAKKSKKKILLAGQIQPKEKDYFEKRIKPHLSKKVKYVGELSQKDLSDFYGPAKVLLYPIEWEEPFGLVVIEAMACGTPVIAFKKGSMPEIIKNGKTGFLVQDVPQMIKAIKNIDRIKREDCRKRVEKYFNYKKMVDNYEKIYYQLIT